MSLLIYPVQIPSIDTDPLVILTGKNFLTLSFDSANLIISEDQGRKNLFAGHLAPK